MSTKFCENKSLHSSQTGINSSTKIIFFVCFVFCVFQFCFAHFEHSTATRLTLNTTFFKPKCPIQNHNTFPKNTSSTNIPWDACDHNSNTSTPMATNK